MSKISVFEEIQYSFKILTNNDFELAHCELVDFPSLIPIDSATLKSFALKKFWDKLGTLTVSSGECSLCRCQKSSAEHLISCTAPHKSYNEFVLPPMDKFMRALGLPAINVAEALEIFSRLNPTWSIALFRSILPFSLVKALLATLPTPLVFPVLGRWSTLSTLWTYVELYLPLKSKEERSQRRMSIEYILNESETESDSDESDSMVPDTPSYSIKPSQFPSPPDPDFDFSRNPVFCI